MAPMPAGAEQQRLGLGDHAGVPEPRVLPAERHVVAGGVAPGRAARLGVQHQREEAERLRLRRAAAAPTSRARKIASPVSSRRAASVPAASVQPSAKAA